MQHKCYSCGNWLKPSHRKSCPAKKIIFNSCTGCGHFEKHCKKASEIQVEALEFTQYKTSVIQKWDEEKDDKELGVFVTRTVWDEFGNENRNLLNVQMRKTGGKRISR